MSTRDSRIADNLSAIRQQMADAAARSGRRLDDITLVGVTKYVDDATARQVAEAGCLDLGESRPQQFWPRAEALAPLGVRWHLIGHLQRNKVKRSLPHLHLLHAGDSLRLLAAVHEAALEANITQRVLLEVNISGDVAKHGFAPTEMELLLPKFAELTQLKIEGLMAMASLTGGPDQARRDFIALRELRDQLQANCPASLQLSELSMGMSGDFAIAIEEGATLVRVGSSLFDGLDV
ncbi:YggS family pyridoxal phosphate-dependent enzyme [Lignipirellula cremea]|uniref:Pyridoxal phosphate homeostasis protein n=1 Tax=Lignipirellula cremea TaxID=2528010 RepID=A0A518DPM3_9BACT|nr:YggS family pyridoxal phosphate-dependent enzyme [Lignipirellula cremea]QDU93788.1 Pyridoxal phosphate homeostasis protein [Lignipirellula cremea]